MFIWIFLGALILGIFSLGISTHHFFGYELNLGHIPYYTLHGYLWLIVLMIIFSLFYTISQV